MALLDDATYKSQKRAVILATVWLTVITIVEVLIAVWYMNKYGDGEGPRILLNGFFVLASLLKAYFIVGEFMHVKYEKRALMITILGPTIFLLWFVIAFLWEGTAWLNMREVWGLVGM